MGKAMTRRGALAAGVAAGGAAALASMAGQALADEAGASETGQAYDQECDVLVIGGGFGGLVAAAVAAEKGAGVILLEASPAVGGTGLLCSGSMGFGSGDTITKEDLMAASPFADPEMCEAYAAGWQPMIDWLDTTEIPHVRPTNVRVFFGNESQAEGYVSTTAPEGNVEFAQGCAAHIEKFGGQILTSTRATELLTDGEGAVVGARAVTSAGEKLAIGAKRVILACGGFEADKGMMENAFGVNGDLLGVRADPHNNGDAIRMAQAVGAGVSRGLGTFYGHHQAWPFVINQDADVWDANMGDSDWLANQQGMMSNIQSFIGYCCVVNQQGERYADESQGDNIVAQATAQQQFARGYVLLDSKIRSEDVTVQGRLGKERIDILQENGATILTADTLDGLADALKERFGVPKANLLATVAEYNEAAAAGTAGDLRVPKANAERAIPLEEGPFYAIPAVPGVSLNFGGVLINGKAQVLDTAHRPISGLYSVLGAAGGLHYYQMLGAISSICSFAYLAATDAVEGL